MNGRDTVSPSGDDTRRQSAQRLPGKYRPPSEAASPDWLHL